MSHNPELLAKLLEGMTPEELRLQLMGVVTPPAVFKGSGEPPTKEWKEHTDALWTAGYSGPRCRC